jgi:hypothetical protein
MLRSRIDQYYIARNPNSYANIEAFATSQIIHGTFEWQQKWLKWRESVGFRIDIKDAFSEDEIQQLKELETILKDKNDVVWGGKKKYILFTIKDNSSIRQSNALLYLHLYVETNAMSLTLNMDDGMIISKSRKISRAQKKAASAWMMKCKTILLSRRNYIEYIKGLKLLG